MPVAQIKINDESLVGVFTVNSAKAARRIDFCAREIGDATSVKLNPEAFISRACFEADVLWPVKGECRIGIVLRALNRKRQGRRQIGKTRGFGSFGNDPRKGYAVEPYYQYGEPRVLGASLAYRF